MIPKDMSAYTDSFLRSAKEHIENLDAELEKLRSTEPTHDLIDDLYLHLHSLKGECGAMGFESIASKCEDPLDFLNGEKEKATSSQNILKAIDQNIKSIKSDILSIEQELPNQNNTNDKTL